MQTDIGNIKTSCLTLLQILPFSPVCLVNNFLPIILEAYSLHSSGLHVYNVKKGYIFKANIIEF